ncbi:hypothetical protein BX666DRAFT_2022563 [Dichotomocladium elegans]|nr:hypothetical protein BX666DRAFT_2022563 [Dichotomocladium elegans]
MSKDASVGNSLRSEADAKRKVYKNVLNTPYAIRWPAIPNELNETILTDLINILAPIGQYRQARKEQRKSQKKQDAKAAVAPPPPAEPELHKRLVIGLNDVTRFLEKEIEHRGGKAESATSGTTTAIFVCRRDLQPSHLCNHLPAMACLAKAKLVGLPKDSSMKLAVALGLQRVGCVLVQIVEDKEERLRLDLEDVPFVDAPWLSSVSDISFQRTQIKTLETTATIKPKKRQAPPPSKASDHPAEKKKKKN